MAAFNVTDYSYTICIYIKYTQTCTVCKLKKTLKVLYLLQLVVFLQDQVNDVTDDRDFPQRETPLEELLLGQYGFVVEDISQHLHTQNTHSQLNRAVHVSRIIVSVKVRVHCTLVG